MRLLIGNDTDPSLISKQDVRSWTQRVLWFAENGDSIILMSPPDKDFLSQVSAVTGVDPSSLSFHIMPKLKDNRHICDSRLLLTKPLIDEISKKRSKITQIVPLWPSQHVAHFAKTLGLSQLLPGYKFISQNGGELCNNKANFRAFAAQAGIPLPLGMVCRSKDEAIESTEILFRGCDAAMVKKAHAGGGGGNQLLSNNPEVTSCMTGAVSEFRVSKKKDSIRKYWDAQWQWASADGQQPVIVEEFVRNAESVYAEFECTDHDGVGVPKLGFLRYSFGRLAGEFTPIPSLSLPARDALVSYGTRLAEIYYRMGYRGFLSVDAIVTADNQIYFNEVNAQFTGSTHLYKAIGKAVTGDDLSLDYSVLQFTFPSPVENLSRFMGIIHDLNLGFDARHKKGIVPAWPIVETQVGGVLLLCAIANDYDSTEKLASDLIDNSPSNNR